MTGTMKQSFNAWKGPGSGALNVRRSVLMDALKVLYIGTAKHFATSLKDGFDSGHTKTQMSSIS